MKTKNQKKIIISILLSLCLIFHINSLSYTTQDIIQENAEFAKVCTLEDGNVLALSSVINSQQMKVSKLDNQGRFIFKNETINMGYTADAQLVQPAKSDNYLLTHHNRQNVAGHEAKEYVLTFKGKNSVVKSVVRNNSLYQKSSAVPLKNGKVLVVGLNYIPSFGSETTADANVFDPNTGSFGNGISFKAHSKYISCYEQKENEVLCTYVSYEDAFVSKIKIKHLTVNGNTLTQKDYEVVKNFYTEYNYLKAIPFDESDTLILFQTGNPKSSPIHSRYGNEGKNLFFYHLQVVLSTGEIKIKRYEYLYPNCLFREDAEDYNADIAVLSLKRIYAVCETSLNRFRGFIIYPDKSEIDEFNFNNFNADNVKNPVFAKFDKSLGIFYTQITVNYNSRVAYHLMNYPDCSDYRNYNILLPRGFVKELEFEGKVFLNNPYPASRAEEEVKFRFKTYSNITIINIADGSALKPNVDYKTAITLKFLTKQLTGKYAIEYTATREDPLDGLIIGKTCKVAFNTPECLPQCESCTEKGTEEHHFCLGCNANGSYYEEEDVDGVNIGYGKPHFCRRCNISCSTCYGAFIERPETTTNCKLCDYSNNYFHYELDERTCISNETKKYWEDVLGGALFLDTTPGPDKKAEWRWKHCHQNCAECFEKGDDINNKCNKCKKGLYFFCNQTVGDGIPGSCHADCPNNGFYVTIDEDREKCCPCLDHCKECKNATICDKCYRPFLLTPDHTQCNESCGYCLAEDRVLGECVNCKTRYGTPKYTLNKTCVNEIPFIEFLKRYHHIVDDECNLLHGCKEGCYKCDPWYTDNCTECNASYYKEDFYSIEPKPKTFKCFNETTCQGVTPYKHNEKLRIGGVPILEGKENVCLNCRLRNNSYRLPENKFYCGDKIARTYVDIDEYNKLSYCYFRCKSCDYWGNACVMNCSTCRDPANYEPLVKIGDYYNCYKKPHKCGIFPYYHNYDLAEELGIDEDNCGQNCDVCLYNFTCTEEFPYFVYETHECVEYCPLSDVLQGSCLLNNTRAGILLLQNPLGLKNNYDYLNSSITLNQVISSQFFEYITKSYNIEVNSIKNDINNYLGNGQIYNLPESKIIIGNNISIELSSFKLELEKIQKLLQGDTSVSKTSAIDFSKCETILKKKYGISQDEDLIILKGDFLEENPIIKEYLPNQVEYQVFSTSLGAFLPLNDCKEEGATVTVTNPFNTTLLNGIFQFKTTSVVESGYNAFDINSSFYNDICTDFTNENGNDVLLDERRTDYFNQDYNLCEKGCKFIGFNETINMYTCECSVKNTINDEITYEQTPMEVPEDFFKKQTGYSNIKVFKCASQVFSSKGQKMNFGSYVLFACFVGFIVIVVLYCLMGNKAMENAFKTLAINSQIKKEKSQDNNIPLANPPKSTDKEKGDYDIFVKPQNKAQNVIEDYVIKEDQLNSADYSIAVEDKRPFIRYYWSLLKMKQICIFTFYTYTDYNIRLIKIGLFILFLSFYFAFTALFFTDNIIRNIYIYKGNTDAAVHVTNIVLSSLCTLIMSYIVRFVTLTQRDVISIITEENDQKRSEKIQQITKSLKIKTIILFIISGLLIGLCWYYVAAFCAVFKNSQGHYFINVLIAFIVCNIWPCVTSLIAPIFRIKSIKDKNSPCMYKFSQIIAYF